MLRMQTVEVQLPLGRHIKLNEAIIYVLEFETAKKVCEQLRNMDHMWAASEEENAVMGH